MTNLLILKDLKRDNYNSVFVIINLKNKRINYKTIKTNINTLKLAEFIIKVGVRFNIILNAIINNKNMLFIAKLCSSLCYFLNIN